MNPRCPLCDLENARPLLDTASRRYFSCPRCELRFLDRGQLPSSTTEKAEYDQHQNDPHDASYRDFLSTLFKPLSIKLPSAMQGLDYGCGPGPALVEMFKEAGHSMTAFDPIYRPDLSALSRHYDFITCTEVVEHFHRPSREFERLDGLLKPGGLLGVMTRLQTDDAKFEHWQYRRDPTHVAFYRAETLQWIAKWLGWTVQISPPQLAIFRKPEDRRNRQD